MNEEDKNSFVGYEWDPWIDSWRSEETRVHGFTDRPAPVLPGLHCIQAIPEASDGLQVASYRRNLGSVEGWIATISRAYSFPTFLIKRDQVNGWTSFDSKGFITGFYDRIETRQVEESCDKISVSRDDFTSHAREVIGDERLHLVACAEHHAGANSADHSNFSVMLTRMISDASGLDLERVFLVESTQWPCRVSGLFANLEGMSRNQQDVYLDRYKWLSKSWPLVPGHHQEVLAHRLAACREPYMKDLITECGKASGMSPELILGLLCRWMLASPTEKLKFSQDTVNCLKEGLVFEHRRAEVFDAKCIKEHAVTIIDFLQRRIR